MNEKRAIPRAGEFYRHFKNKLYQIVTIAVHSETEEVLVIYQALYGDFQIYARPLSMFLSEVDHEKYPQVKAKYRFEKINMGQTSFEGAEESAWKMSEIDTVPESTVQEVQPADGAEDIAPLLEFLDAKDHQEKRNILIQYKSELSETLLESMGLSIDCVLSGVGKEEKYYELEKILSTKIQYEKKPR